MVDNDPMTCIHFCQTKEVILHCLSLNTKPSAIFVQAIKSLT